VKINEFAIIKVGQNISRLSDEELKEQPFYTFDDLNFDLCQMDDIKQKGHPENNHLTYTGDIVISFVGTKATIVTEENKGKLLNQNFAKIMIDNTLVDPYYFCYILNESKQIQKQKNIFMQGTNLPKMTPAILKELDVHLPTLQKQKFIGNAYFNLCKRQYLLERQSDLEEQFFLKLIQQSDVENN